jgi:hypothetical protein
LVIHRQALATPQLRQFRRFRILFHYVTLSYGVTSYCTIPTPLDSRDILQFPLAAENHVFIIGRGFNRRVTHRHHRPAGMSDSSLLNSRNITLYRVDPIPECHTNITNQPGHHRGPTQMLVTCTFYGKSNFRATPSQSEGL